MLFEGALVPLALVASIFAVATTVLLSRHHPLTRSSSLLFAARRLTGPPLSPLHESFTPVPTHPAHTIRGLIFPPPYCWSHVAESTCPRGEEREEQQQREEPPSHQRPPPEAGQKSKERPNEPESIVAWSQDANAMVRAKNWWRQLVARRREERAGARGRGRGHRSVAGRLGKRRVLPRCALLLSSDTSHDY